MNFKIKVLVVVEDLEGNVLLVEEKIRRNKIAKWNFVRGTIYKFKEMPVLAAKREVREEVGIVEFEKFRLIKIKLFREGLKLRLYFIYNALCKSEVEISFSENESDENILGYKWVSKQELLQIKDENFVDDLVAKARNYFLR